MSSTNITSILFRHLLILYSVPEKTVQWSIWPLRTVERMLLMRGNCTSPLCSLRSRSMLCFKAMQTSTSRPSVPWDINRNSSGRFPLPMLSTFLGVLSLLCSDFSLLESFSVSFSVLGLLPSIASTISYSLGYSGTGGAVWGWLIASLFIQSTAFSLAELCSSMPTAGGLYYAAAVLAPEGWGPLASWFVGWSNFCGFVTGPCSLNYALGKGSP